MAALMNEGTARPVPRKGDWEETGAREPGGSAGGRKVAGLPPAADGQSSTHRAPAAAMNGRALRAGINRPPYEAGRWIGGSARKHGRTSGSLRLVGSGRGRLLAHDRPGCARAQLLAIDRLPLLARGPLDARAVARGNFGGFLQPVVDVPGFDVLPGGLSDGALAAENANGCCEGFLRCHFPGSVGKLVCMLGANLFAGKPGKIFCVETLGEFVKRWRVASGLKPADLARLVGNGVKRQNIEQLEASGIEAPRYLVHLAKAMRCTVEDLAARRMPPPLNEPVQEAAAISGEQEFAYATPPQDGTALQRLTAAEVDLVQAFRFLPDDEQLDLVRDVMAAAERYRNFVARELERRGLPFTGYVPASKAMKHLPPAPTNLKPPPSLAPEGGHVPSPLRRPAAKAAASKKRVKK